MTVKEAMIIINNPDVSGVRRKLRPKHALIQIDRNGEIEGIYQYKKLPSEAQQLAALKKHPGTIQIPASEDTYQDERELQHAIQKTMWLFEHMKQ